MTTADLAWSEQLAREPPLSLALAALSACGLGFGGVLGLVMWTVLGPAG